MKASIRLAIGLFCCLLGHCANAQDNVNVANISKNIFYLEGLGPGGLGSVNYERIVYKKDLFQTSVRLGLGFNRFNDFRDKFNPDFSVPIGVGIAFGTRFKGEAFVGTTYTNNVVATPTLEPERTTALHAYFGIGARYQSYKGLFARIGYSPLLEKFTYFRHWGYLSIGWVF